MMNNENLVLSDNCTGRRGNVACRKAHNAGRSVHVITPAGCGVVMPTWHFATVAEGLAAVADAMANAPMVATDEDLYRFRREGVAYRLPVGWIDPTRR